VPFATNHPLVQTQCGHIFHRECQEKEKYGKDMCLLQTEGACGGRVERKWRHWSENGNQN